MCIESRRIAVIGMGPAGGILGAHLSAAGHQVLAVEAWPGHREALAGKGLVLDGKLQLETAPLQVLSCIAELAGHLPDLIVLALKIPEALQALQEVAALRTAAPVMLLQNGLEVEEACGYRVSPEFIHFSRHYLAQGDGHRPSMLMDLDRGRGTEIDWLNGKIVELARRHEIPVPVNEVITALVKSLEPSDEEPRSR
jgi:ketopantoate reductase